MSDLKQFMKPQNSSNTPGPNRAGFSRADLLAIVGALLLLFVLATRTLASMRAVDGRLICFSNLRVLMLGVNQYAEDHNDLMPHPSWGTVPSGPNNWLYATQIDRQPMPSLQNIPTNTAQLPYLHAGQIWQYVKRDSAFECPDDLSRQDPNSSRNRGRPLKLTSYIMNGVVGGYVGPRGSQGSAGLGTIFPISRFRSDAIILWEQDESDSFAFNDAASNPETLSEGLTQRHRGQLNNSSRSSSAFDRPYIGGGNVGRLDGGAEYMDRNTYDRLVRHVVPVPNRLLCEPGW